MQFEWRATSSPYSKAIDSEEHWTETFNKGLSKLIKSTGIFLLQHSRLRSLNLQLKEAEERRLSRSSSKSPGVRAQESPIHFAQSEPAPNQDNKPPEVKTQDSQPVSVADVADPKSLELEISAETSNPEVQGAKSVSSVEEKNGDNEGCGDTVPLKEVDAQVQMNNPKPKPRRKPQ